METNEDNKPVSGTEIAAEQVDEVAGGTATTTITACGPSITSSGATVGTTLIDIYEGAVEVTTHVMERVTGKS